MAGVSEGVSICAIAHGYEQCQLFLGMHAWDLTAIPGIAPATDDIHRATHVVLRHKQLAAYRSARCLRKKMVSIFWAAELAKQGQLMPLDDPLFRPFRGAAIDGAGDLEVTVTGFQGLQRHFMLGLIQCAGMKAVGPMDVRTVTHVLAENVAAPSEKLVAARKPENRRIHVVNCQWLYDTVRFWQVRDPGSYDQPCSSDPAASWPPAGPIPQAALQSPSPLKPDCIPESDDEEQHAARGAPGAPQDKPRMQQGKTTEPERNRPAGGGNNHLSPGAHKAAGCQQEDALPDPDGTNCGGSKHNAPATTCEAASGQHQEPGDASQPHADGAAMQEQGAEHWMGAAAASTGAFASGGRPSALGVGLESIFEAVAYEPAAGAGKFKAAAAGAGKAEASAAGAGSTPPCDAGAGAALAAPAEQGCHAAQQGSLPMSTLSTAVVVGASEATQDAQTGSITAKQHSHQAEVIEAVRELPAAGSESEATEAAAGVVERGAAACREALAGGSGLHATEGGEAGRRLGAAAQAQLTRTMLQQHETGVSQAASAFSKVRQFLRDMDPAEGSEEAQPLSDAVISPIGKAAAVSGPSSRAAEKQAHLCKGDRAAVPSSHAAGVNEQRWRGGTGAAAAAALADSEHGTGAAGASRSGAAEDAAAAGGSRAGQDGAEQDGSDAEMLDAPAEGEGPKGASLDRVPPPQQHSQGGAEGSKTLAPRQARSRQAPASQQTTRRQQARGASRLGKRKALQPAAPADAANPGTIGPPSSAPSRLRGKAAPQQQRTQASEPQALLGRRVHKHFEEGWFEGAVTAYNAMSQWWRVEYEDGDREDLSWQELQPHLLPLEPGTSNPSASLGDTCGEADQQDAEGLSDSHSQGGGPDTSSRGGKRQRTSWGSGKRAAQPLEAMRPLVLLSSMHSSEQAKCTKALAKLGIPCLSHADCQRWRDRTTHVVMPSLGRTLKALAGMAAGRWLVSTKFVDDCKEAQGLAEPGPRELGSRACKADMAEGAPRHWRQRYEATGEGAFVGLQFVLFGKCDEPGPDHQDLRTIIEAGGGAVTRCDKEMSTALTTLIRQKGVHAALMRADTSGALGPVQALLEAQVPCASPRFLVEWLAHPFDQTLEDHLLFGSKLSKELSQTLQAR